MSPSGFAAMWQERDRQSSPEVPVPAPCPLALSVCPVPLRPMPIQQLSPGGLLGSGPGSTAHPLHGVVPPAPPPSLVEQALGVAGKRNPASAAAAAAMSQHRQLNSRAHHFQPLGVSVSPAASAGSPPLLPGRPPPRLQGIGLAAVQSMKPGQGTPPTAAPSPLELLQQRSDMSQVRVREQRAAAERVKRKSEQDLRSAARSRVNEQAYADQVADFLRTQQDGVSDTSAIGNKVPRAAGARKLSHVLKSYPNLFELTTSQDGHPTVRLKGAQGFSSLLLAEAAVTEGDTPTFIGPALPAHLSAESMAASARARTVEAARAVAAALRSPEADASPSPELAVDITAADETKARADAAAAERARQGAAAKAAAAARARQEAEAAALQQAKAKAAAEADAQYDMLMAEVGEAAAKAQQAAAAAAARAAAKEKARQDGVAKAAAEARAAAKETARQEAAAKVAAAASAAAEQQQAWQAAAKVAADAETARVAEEEKARQEAEAALQAQTTAAAVSSGILHAQHDQLMAELGEMDGAAPADAPPPSPPPPTVTAPPAAVPEVHPSAWRRKFSERKQRWFRVSPEGRSRWEKDFSPDELAPPGPPPPGPPPPCYPQLLNDIQGMLDRRTLPPAAADTEGPASPVSAPAVSEDAGGAGGWDDQTPAPTIDLPQRPGARGAHGSLVTS